jgi:hypothetical protein
LFAATAGKTARKGPEFVLFEPLRLIAPAKNLVIEFFCAEPLVFF